MGVPHQPNGEGASRKEPSEVGVWSVENINGVLGEEILKKNGADYVPNGDVTAASQQSDKQNPLQAPIIQWERFLPIKSLKVLLVESDDCTRHVVSALLRNCCYEVVTAENGLQAWKLLEDLSNRIDLVLTEVSMPYLSGIGLLSKIMSHGACKNIPVIMMSSIDSTDTVFTCLSKGALDFLVKPIRKNELKTLWQHVWRRCPSYSGSASQSGIQTQKGAKSKRGDESGNNSGSNDDENDTGSGSIGLNARGGSDNGSGTQNSWRKHAVEIDSPQPMSPSDQADPPDSTCAQVIYPNPELRWNGWLSMTANRSPKKQKECHDDFMGKDLEIGIVGTSNSNCETFPVKQSPTKPSEANLEKMHQNLESETMAKFDGSNTLEEPTQAADLIGSIAKSMDARNATRAAEAPDGFSEALEGNEKNHPALIETPSLELSLKRLRSTGDVPAAQDERNVLKRSDLSAFTRYHTPAVSNQCLTGFGGSCSPVGNSSDARKTDGTCDLKSTSNAAQTKQGSNGSSDNNDKISTTSNVVSKPAANKEKISPPSAVKSGQHASAFDAVQSRSSASGPATEEKVDEETAATAGGSDRDVVERHHHHHYHHHYDHHHDHHHDHHYDHHHDHHYDHHHYHPTHGNAMKNKQAAAPPAQNLPLNNVKAVDSQCGTSNATAVPIEGHAANFSLNGNDSGSNNGSSRQNESIAAVNAGVSMGRANGVVDKPSACGGKQSGPSGSGSGLSGSGSGIGSGVYQHWLTQREVALNKFRQKRKERNFGKKVRYQSRKRLAEQRPRVRGQFVRQQLQDNAGGQADR